MSTKLGGLLSASPGGHQVSLKDGPRGSQSRQYQSELYLHAGCKETQCKHVSGSVSNWRQYERPLGICTWVGVATVLAYARVIYHGIYLQEFVRHMTMYAVCFSYKGVLYLKCQLNTCYTAVVRVKYFFNSGHQESSQPFIVDACFGFFKLSTCSSLLIGRGHSTWFGTQILTQLYIYSLYSIGGSEHLHVVLLGSWFCHALT